MRGLFWGEQDRREWRKRLRREDFRTVFPHRAGEAMYKYDAALSYESASEDFVREVAGFLEEDGWNIFFAPQRKRELLSENLRRELYRIYHKESLVKALFVTDRYLESPYTMLEARRSLCSAGDNPRRLIVVNFIGARLPQELAPFVYLEGTDFSDRIASLISGRIAELKGQQEQKADGQRQDGEKEDGVVGTCNYHVITGNTGIVIGNNAKINHVNFKGAGHKDGR